MFFIIVSSREIFIARFPSVIYFTSGLKPLNHLRQWDVNPKLMLLFPALENSYVNLIRVLIGNFSTSFYFLKKSTFDDSTKDIPRNLHESSDSKEDDLYTKFWKFASFHDRRYETEVTIKIS